MCSKCLTIFWNFTAIVWICISVPHECEPYRDIEFVQLLQYADLYVSNGILWNLEVQNIFNCVIECDGNPPCVSFFFDSNNCSGYDQHSPSNEHRMMFAGKVFYINKNSKDLFLNQNTTNANTIIPEIRFSEASTSSIFISEKTTRGQNAETSQQYSTTQVQTESSTVDPTFPTTSGISSSTVDSASAWCSGDRYIEDTVNKKCYKAWNTQLQWSAARTICQNEGGDLAILDTANKIALMAVIPDYRCPKGTLAPFINKCYYTTSVAKIWTETGIDCNSTGGMLASFPNNSSYNFVINVTGILQSTEYWWLGLNDIAVEGQMKTFDNQPMPWDNIVSPYGWFTKDCIAISPPDKFKWLEHECGVALHRGVCEILLVTDFWIAGSDLSTENDWKWTNGVNMDMTKWHPGQPSGNTTENCAVLRYDRNGNYFADEVCSQTRNFICEKTLP